MLDGSLPAILADLLKKVTEGTYVELSTFLPKRITESFLYPEARVLAVPIEKFPELVMAFCCFGLTLMQRSPDLGADLLMIIGARDHPGLSLASYEQAFQAKMAANPLRR
jgi:hypothetical protein